MKLTIALLLVAVSSDLGQAERIPNLKPRCRIPQDTSNPFCRMGGVGWRYDMQAVRCVEYDSGCGQNDNHFETLNECEEYCFEPKSKAVTRDPICELPLLDRPICRMGGNGWRFDKNINRCIEYDSACPLNANHFSSEAECAETCLPDNRRARNSNVERIVYPDEFDKFKAQQYPKWGY